MDLSASAVPQIIASELPPPPPAAAPASSQGAAQSLFASTLDEVQKKEKKDDLAEKEEASAAPKIARSWRMDGADKATEVHEAEDLEWGDLVDLINPLQHIPILGTVYREATGDKIKPEIQVAGNALFGALTGSLAISTVAGILTAAYEEHSGEEATIQIADALFGGDEVGEPDPQAGTIQLAAAPETAAQSSAQSPAQPSTPASAPGAPVLVASASSDALSSPASVSAVSSGAASGAAAAVLPSSTPVSTSSRRISKTASSQGIRVGQTLYPKKMVSAGQAASVRPASQETAKLSLEGAALAASMRSQAEAKAAGGQVSPALVHDMMIKALDKYQAAYALTVDPVQAAVSVQ